ncbi:hypothetical protein TL16_g00353 [Triparma laevis f. inornata]|uniref:Uncharacterized protein n=1 Tax=Triparma laevis f. inornata TaxID=1714386 RepID=A0A9W7DNF4_9STRA|nr:hypothetical protein TL16_g00353 [Triparma laevis f. inornata]
MEKSYCKLSLLSYNVNSCLNCQGLLKPEPWLIFPEDKGSIGGFFDFVPEYLRVGPWFFLAPVFVLAYTLFIFYLKPPINLASTDPQLYSFPHIFSLVSTFNGCHILHMILSKTGPAPLVTFTIISWTILTFRGFLAFLNPFYPIPFLSTLSSSLRFPALVAATVTFVIWNFVLAPIFYTFWSKGEEAKKNFKNWNTQYHMIHIHFLNYPIAIVSCVLTCENVLFTEVDLWISYFVLFMYACLYLFILDRIGVHLYPVFSPRSKFSCFTWLTVFGLYYATFNFWNFVIEGQYLRDVVTPLFSK